MLYRATFTHDREGEIIVDIEHDGDLSSNLDYDNLTSALQAAANSAAARYIDYDAFTSDSLYQTTIEAFQAHMTITDLTLASTEPLKRYVWEFRYSDGSNQTCADEAMAVNEIDAALSARWTMMGNASAPDRTANNIDDFVADFLSFDQIEITREPISFYDFRAEVKAALEKLPAPPVEFNTVLDHLAEFEALNAPISSAP